MARRQTQDWISKTYRISSGTLKRYIRRYEAIGSVPADFAQSLPRCISATYDPKLKALVAREPFAKLERYCAEWERETGMVVTIKTMSRMLVRLGLRQKNDRGRLRAR